MVRRVSIAGLGLVLSGVPLSAGLSGCAPSQGMAIADQTVPPAALSEGFEPIANQINRERDLLKGRSTPLASRPATAPNASKDPAYDPESSLASLPAVESPNLPVDAVAQGRPAPYLGRVPDAARPQATGASAGGARPARSAPEDPPAPRPQRTASNANQGRPTSPASASNAPDDPGGIPTLEPFSPAPLKPRVAANEPAPTPSPQPAREPEPIKEPAPEPVKVVEAAPVPTPEPDQPPTTPQTNPFASVAKVAPIGAAPRSAARASSPIDKSVIAVKSEALDKRPEAMTKGAGWVATVGDEIITWSEFQPIVQSRLRQMGGNGQQIDDATKNQIAAAALGGLIEQSILVQEMKRKIKNPKMINLFQDQLLKGWEEEELPVMLREAKAANIYELKAILEKSGQSLDRIQRSFVRNHMAREVMGMELRGKMKVDLPEMRSYYNENLRDFERHAQIIWREIQVDFDKSKSKAEAKGKADQLLQRLRNGEDFAAVAKAASNGPTASKGGLWETAPGSYNVPAVNAALERLPIGQMSPVVESPTSFHIVKVESRREAGPARFDEVQDKIRGILFERKAEAASNAYLKKLRDKTVVTTMFDGTASDPKRQR